MLNDHQPCFKSVSYNELWLKFTLINTGPPIRICPFIIGFLSEFFSCKEQTGCVGIDCSWFCADKMENIPFHFFIRLRSHTTMNPGSSIIGVPIVDVAEIEYVLQTEALNQGFISYPRLLRKQMSESKSYEYMGL